MNQKQALSILEAALNTAMAGGIFKNMQEAAAVMQALSVLSANIEIQKKDV